MVPAVHDLHQAEMYLVSLHLYIASVRHSAACTTATMKRKSSALWSGSNKCYSILITSNIHVLGGLSFFFTFHFSPCAADLVVRTLYVIFSEHPQHSREVRRPDSTLFETQHRLSPRYNATKPAENFAKQSTRVYLCRVLYKERETVTCGSEQDPVARRCAQPASCRRWAVSGHYTRIGSQLQHIIIIIIIILPTCRHVVYVGRYMYSTSAQQT